MQFFRNEVTKVYTYDLINHQTWNGSHITDRNINTPYANYYDNINTDFGT